MKRALLTFLVVAVTGIWAMAQGPTKEEVTKTWKSSVTKAIELLRKNQATDGSWSSDKSIGITGIVLTGLLSTGEVELSDPMVQKALAYMETLINTKDGHIAGNGPKPQMKNYVTAVNVMGFAAANKNGKYDKVVQDAAKFLIGLQWDESENIGPNDVRFGGFGYDSKNNPDMSNSQFAIDALHSAGIPKSDKAFQKAVTFVSRSQNLKSESQDQPWAAIINDGSFIYNPLETKADVQSNGGRPGTASMTYAGIKSMIYAGVKKDDFRIQAALGWIKKNFDLKGHPGMPPAKAKTGIYYYYQTMAKTLAVLELDVIEDDKGVKHDWRAELTVHLAKEQKADGSWGNDQDRWMEGDPNLVTAYSLLALGYAKPK